MTGDVYRNSRALKQLESLSHMGLNTIVLCLEGSGQTVQVPSGVHIRQMPVPAGHGPSFFRQIHVGMGDMMRAVTARWYHASDVYVLPACASRARQTGSPWSYDSRELYAHVAATAGRPWVSWFWRLLEGRYIRGARVVFTVSDRIADHLAAAYGMERPTVVHNAPLAASSRAVVHPAIPHPSIRETFPGIGPAPIVLHLGQMRRARGLTHLVRAMPSVPHAHLVFLGYGPERAALESLVEEMGLTERIHFMDAVPPSMVPRVASDANLGVALLEDSCLNHRYALPNKLFEYIAAGLPVVASDLPEMRTVLESVGAGVTVQPEDHMELAGAIQYVLDHPTEFRDGVRQAAETFTWEAVSPAFTAPFRSLT